MSEKTLTREVTVVSTRGAKKYKMDFGGSKWGELETRLRSEGYDLKNIKAVDGISRHTLEHPDATLPTGKFTLYLMPMESKAGAKKEEKKIDRKELYTKIKGFITADEKKAKKFFTKNGKNYTMIDSESLAKLVDKYTGPSTKPKEKAVAKAKSSGADKEGGKSKTVVEAGGLATKAVAKEEEFIPMKELAKGFKGIKTDEIDRSDRGY